MRYHPLTHLPHATVVALHLMVGATALLLWYGPGPLVGLLCVTAGSHGLSVARRLHLPPAEALSAG